MHDRVTICGGVLGGHPRLVADAILALSVANCRSTWRWRDGSSARIGAHRKAPGTNLKWPIGKVGGLERAPERSNAAILIVAFQTGRASR